MVLEEFNESEIMDHLEHDYMEDLGLLAIKFGTMIGSIEDIEEVHVSEIDGDHMQLDVVYCDRNEQTCVAVAVPIMFPYRCQNENNVIDAIHQLEEMEDLERGSEVKIFKKPISPEMMETIARICVVMNRDFQDELVSFVQAFGGGDADRPTGTCEMVSLTPSGFLVQAELFPEHPVTVSFPAECQSARDFQRQILEVSQQAMMIV